MKNLQPKKKSALTPWIQYVYYTFPQIFSTHHTFNNVFNTYLAIWTVSSFRIGTLSVLLTIFPSRYTKLHQYFHVPSKLHQWVGFPALLTLPWVSSMKAQAEWKWVTWFLDLQISPCQLTENSLDCSNNDQRYY